jgi:Flp pilus assembly protein TadB
MIPLLLVALACTFSVGVLLLTTAWTDSTARPRRSPDFDRERMLIDGGAAITVALGLFVVTGWLVALGVGGFIGWQLSVAWRNYRAGNKSDQERIEALATWCEQLRDLMSAEHGVLGTVVATTATCPAAIRPEVTRLATRIERTNPSTAIRQFAVEVDDPSGDLIASVLVLAMSHSGKTSELLSELASTIRERAAMRLRVEAERSGQRAEARFVIGFSLVVMIAIALFGRDSQFLDAYDSAIGQLVLLLIASAFGVGMLWLSRLTRFERPARFLSIGGDR